jgi:hypothetical protein
MNTIPETEKAVTAKTIPILSDPKQWHEWRDAITDYLGTQKLGETLRTTYAAPRDPSNGGTVEGVAASIMDRYEDRLEKFNEKQSQGLGILRSCCGVEARDKIKESATVVTALEVLRKDYTPLGSHLVRELWTQFVTLHLRGFDTVSGFSEKLRYITTELKRLDPNMAPTERMLVTKLLTSLGDDFESNVDTFLQSKTIVQVPADLAETNRLPMATYADALLMAQNAEFSHGIKEREAETRTAMLGVKPGKRNSGNGGKYWCKKCKVSSHSDERCFDQHPELREKHLQMLKERQTLRRDKKITRRNDSSQLDDTQPQQSDNEDDGLTNPAAGLAMSEDADELMNDNYPRPVSWVAFA